MMRRPPPPVPSAQEFYKKGKDIGFLNVRFGIAGNELKLQSEWHNFRLQDIQKFEKDPVIKLLKGMYQKMNPDEFLFRPYFKGCFNDGLPDKKYSIGDPDQLTKAFKEMLSAAVGSFNLKIKRIPDDPIKGSMEISSWWFGFQKKHEELFQRHHMSEDVKRLYNMLKDRNAVRIRSGNRPDLFN